MSGQPFFATKSGKKKILLERLQNISEKIDKLTNEIESLGDNEAPPKGAISDDSQYQTTDSIKQKAIEYQNMIKFYLDHMKFLKSVYDIEGDCLLAADCKKETEALKSGLVKESTTNVLIDTPNVVKDNNINKPVATIKSHPSIVTPIVFGKVDFATTVQPSQVATTATIATDIPTASTIATISSNDTTNTDQSVTSTQPTISKTASPFASIAGNKSSTAQTPSPFTFDTPVTTQSSTTPATFPLSNGLLSSTQPIADTSSSKPIPIETSRTEPTSAKPFFSFSTATPAVTEPTPIKTSEIISDAIKNSTVEPKSIKPFFSFSTNTPASSESNATKTSAAEPTSTKPLFSLANITPTTTTNTTTTATAAAAAAVTSTQPIETVKSTSPSTVTTSPETTIQPPATKTAFSFSLGKDTTSSTPTPPSNQPVVANTSTAKPDTKKTKPISFELSSTNSKTTKSKTTTGINISGNILTDSTSKSSNTTDTDTDSKFDALIPKRDFVGLYYEFENVKGQQSKFYYELNSNKLLMKLNSIDEIPRWNSCVSRFSEDWNFHEKGKFHQMNNTVNKILFNVMIESLGKDMETYKTDYHLATDLLNGLIKSFSIKYPNDVKDKLWKTIFVDEWCPLPHSLKMEMHKLINMEIVSYDEANKTRNTNQNINRMIRSRMTESLVDRVMVYALQLGAKKIWELPPKEYLEYFIIYLGHRKTQMQPDEIVTRCLQCNSKYHSVANCPDSY